MPSSPLHFQRTFRLMSRVLCLAAPPIVVLAFWDPHFYPLGIKEILTETCGLLTFLCWKISKSGNRPTDLANPIGWPLLALCLWSLVSIFWTGPREQAIHHS